MKMNPKNKSLILDFDFTLCDSSTRENQHTKNDMLDLQAYRKTTAKHDKALPLLTWLINNKKAVQYKYNVLILTNRDFNADCESPIKELVLNAFMVMHRGIYAPIYGDDFKAILLDKITMGQETVVIDDEPCYLQIARDNNSRAICARKLWNYTQHELTSLLL